MVEQKYKDPDLYTAKTLNKGYVLIKPLIEISEAEQSLFTNFGQKIEALMKSEIFEVRNISPDNNGLYKVGDTVALDMMTYATNPNARSVTFGDDKKDICFVIRENYIITSIEKDEK